MSAPVEVLIRRIPGNDLPLPARSTDFASGFDLRACIGEPLSLEPGERAEVPTGVAVALPPGWEAQIRPRSGLARDKGLTMINSPGTIDADYRGEIQVIAINLGAEPIVIEPGQRIAQMIVQRVVRAEWQEVRELPSSERQAGGFGHTDKK